jgi:hypothetical protein
MQTAAKGVRMVQSGSTRVARVGFGACRIIFCRIWSIPGEKPTENRWDGGMERKTGVISRWFLASRAFREFNQKADRLRETWEDRRITLRARAMERGVPCIVAH